MQALCDLHNKTRFLLGHPEGAGSLSIFWGAFQFIIYATHAPSLAIRMNSVHQLAGRMMLETSLRGFNKRGRLAPHLQTEFLYHGFQNSTLRLCDGFAELKTCTLV